MAAVKRPQGAPEKPVKDVDDEIADRLHGRKQGPAQRGEGPKRAAKPKALPRKAGVLDTTGDNVDDPVAEPDAAQLGGLSAKREEDAKKAAEKRKRDKKKKVTDKDPDERRRRQPDTPDEPAPEPPAPGPLTAAHLVHDSNYYRSQSARKMGFEQTPGIGDFITGLDAPEEGESLGAILPSARARAHPDLPETDIRPPDFLQPLEAMKDIWMRTRGRMTRRTQELLEGIDLEDLLAMVAAVHDSETLVKKQEARITSKLYGELKDEEDSPLLLGFQDPKLTEPWRLFLDGWEIWVPDGEEEGVELFWEGEAEDDEGRPFEIMQSLALIGTELTLSTRLGEVEDAVTFDGENFYRLKTARRAPERPPEA